MIKLQQRRKESFRLDITPLINIVFLLLIFFMLTSTAANQGLDVDLPEAATAEKMNSQELTISIGPEGNIMLDNDPLSLDELTNVLRPLVDARVKKSVVIKADRNIEFDQFGEVVDKAREAGVTDFVIATEMKEAAAVSTKDKG